MANKEMGRIGQRRYSGVFFEEFLPELRGAKGAEVYTEMADNDSTVGAILFAIENLMRNCEFTIEPGGNNAADKKAAEFVQGCMDDMCMTWTDTLSEILSFITYGWSYHEIVYKRRMGKKAGADSSKFDDGLIGWKKLPIRSQETLYEWQYKEHTDDLTGMRQMVVTDTDIVDVVIPVEKALHFMTKSRKQNPEGRSILRTAYRGWYFRKRIEEIEGIGIERDLAGLPVLTPPEGMDIWDAEDPEMSGALQRAEAIVTSIRRDSREGLVKPFGWEFELLSTGSRRQFDTNQIIERYNKQIATSVLTDFVLLGHESVGSFALADNKTKMFALAVGTYLDIVCEVFNSQAIPRLIDINGDAFKGITDYPYMKHGDIEDANLEKIGAFINQMVGCGTLTPDDELEDYVRQIANLPERQTSVPTEQRTGQGADGPAAEDGNGTNKVEPSEETRREQAKEQKKEQDIDDKMDEKEAEEAKKSLGRGEDMPTFNEILYDNDKSSKRVAKTFNQIMKFNPYHDSKGRFTSAGGGVASFSANPNTKAGKLAIERDARLKEREAGKQSARNYGVTNTKDVLDEINKGKTNSLANHLDKNGNLTPEREQVHKDIINKLLYGKEAVEGQATMTMLGGGPASGKSSVMNPDTSKDKHAVTVDPDAFKSMLPGYKEMAEKSSNAAAYYHEESSALAKRFSEVAYRENYNVIYDGTGDGSTGSVAKKINAAKANGYRVEAKYVSIDTEEAVRRNQKRYDDAVAKGETPRLPPVDMVRATHTKCTDISVSMAKEFDYIEIWDNNGARGQQKLIATGGGGKGLIPTDKKAFERYLSKGAKGLDGFVTLPSGEVVPVE